MFCIVCFFEGEISIREDRATLFALDVVGMQRIKFHGKGFTDCMIGPDGSYGRTQAEVADVGGWFG